MLKSFSKFLLLFSVFILAAVAVSAQTDTNASNGRTVQKEELPKAIKETLEKQRIEQEKKDYQELIKKAEEADQLSADLLESYNKNNNLSAEDKKKLDKLEKLLKKIRKELGGSDDNEEKNDEVSEENEDDKPSTVVNALNKLRSTSVNLLDEIKKSSRFSISVVAIQSSNVLLKMIKFLRFYR